MKSMNQSFEPDPSHKAGHVRLSFKSHPGDRFETLSRLSPQLLNTKKHSKSRTLFLLRSVGCGAQGCQLCLRETWDEGGRTAVALGRGGPGLRGSGARPDIAESANLAISCRQRAPTSQPLIPAQECLRVMSYVANRHV